MLYFPLPIILFIILIVLIPVLLIMIQFNVINTAFSNMGLSTLQMVLYFAGVLIFSTINIPVYRKKVSTVIYEKNYFPLFKDNIKSAIIAVNVGGAIIPVLMSLKLLSVIHIPSLIPGIVIVSIVSYFSSKPVKHSGIKIYFILPLIVTVIISYLFCSVEMRSAYAFVSGTWGILMGADIMHLKHIDRLGTGVFSIGGAGVFDSLFFVGIIAAFIL